MVSEQENELLTRTGPGTPGGELLRRYWQPVALTAELPAGGAPLSLRLFSEDLVLFRDEHGRPGLLARYCSHRRADLSYGRIEAGGLRCLYHGWVYDVAGRCLEQPGEPAGSTFCTKIRHPVYPCHEVGGVVFAYLGPGEPPLFPGYEFLTVPEEYRNVTKVLHECNWLQGNEGNIDPVHTSFLHRTFTKDDSPGGGAIIGSQRPLQTILGGDVAPRIEVEPTDFGLRVYTLRAASDDQAYVRVTSLMFPSAGAFPGNSSGPAFAGYGVNWHVPIDDHQHWKFLFDFSRKNPLDKEQFTRLKGDMTPDYRLVRNRTNRYLQDREEMESRTFAGVGTNFNVHDAVVIEGMGLIVDRTRERLGTTDKAIIVYRRLLLQAIKDVQRGRDPLHVVRDPAQNHFADLAVARAIPAGADWRNAWRSAATGAAATP